MKPSNKYTTTTQQDHMQKSVKEDQYELMIKAPFKKGKYFQEKPYYLKERK